MTPQKRLQQLAAAEAHHSDKGYKLGTKEGYEAFAAKRNESSGLAVSAGPVTPEMLRPWTASERDALVQVLEKHGIIQPAQSSGPPPPTYDELLQEVWYLRRRVKQLEKQVFEMGWQISGESMGR
jgi:hypothetical protein